MSTTPTHTLLLLKTNQELTYDMIHAAARRVSETGSRSVLMPPVVAASYQTPNRSNARRCCSKSVSPPVMEPVRHITMRKPTARPMGCRNTA